jgi:hypothetical protein
VNGAAVVPFPVLLSRMRAGVTGKYAPSDVTGDALASFDAVWSKAFAATTL